MFNYYSRDTRVKAEWTPRDCWYEFLIGPSEIYLELSKIHMLNSLRPSDAYMRQ